MHKFKFSSNSDVPTSIFSGNLFYNVYKDSEFLHQGDNINTILSKGYQLRTILKEIEPGKHIAVEGMLLEKNTPLIVKKTGPNVTVESYEFTANRLSGLVAAYTFENRLRYPMITSSEAEVLGLKWDNENENKCRLYLSAVSGTEHFYDQFQFWPLICGLKKLQQNKITVQPVIKMANIKNQNGVRMAKDFMRNLSDVSNLWLYFPDSTKVDLKKQIDLLPPELKKVFFLNK